MVVGDSVTQNQLDNIYDFCFENTDITLSAFFVKTENANTNSRDGVYGNSSSSVTSFPFAVNGRSIGSSYAEPTASDVLSNLELLFGVIIPNNLNVDSLVQPK